MPARIGLALGGSLLLVKNPILGGILVYMGASDTVGYSQEPGEERSYLHGHLQSVSKNLKSLLKRDSR